MNKLFCACAIGALLPVVQVHADLTIVQKVDGMGEAMETTTRYKGGKTRLDETAAGFSIIVDNKTGETTNLQHAAKSYLKASGNLVQAAVDNIKKEQDANQKDGAHPTLQPTGKKETISGHASEEYAYVSGDNKVTMWLTHDLPDYDQVMKELSTVYSDGPLAAVTQNLIDMSHLPGFPMRTVSEGPGGEKLTSTVLSISLKPVADDAFTVPADYKELKMPILTPPAAEALPSPTK